MTLQPDGTARFCRPDGRPLPVAPSAPRWDGPPLAPTLARLGAASITIGAQTGLPHSHGERLDEVWAIDVLWRAATDWGGPGGRWRAESRVLRRTRGKHDGEAYEMA